MDHHPHATGVPAAHHGAAQHHYLMLAVNLGLSLVVMYLVMFSMIDGWADFRNNLDTLYMALAMVAPMGVLMLATMGGMYSRKRLNAALHLLLLAVFVLAFGATREQAGVGDRQFIASMIPHHSGAILMCRESKLRDAELRALCDRIASSQREEIEQMNAIDARLKGGG